MKTNLKSYREIAGLTQAKLSDWSGVSIRMIRLYENGCDHAPNLEIARELARALNTEVDNIFPIGD